MTLIVNSQLHVQAYVKDHLVQKRLQTNGRTDTTDFITFLANVVGDKGVIHPDSTLRSVHITLTELN